MVVVAAEEVAMVVVAAAEVAAVVVAAAAEERSITGHVHLLPKRRSCCHLAVFGCHLVSLCVTAEVPKHRSCHPVHILPCMPPTQQQMDASQHWTLQALKMPNGAQVSPSSSSVPCTAWLVAWLW